MCRGGVSARNLEVILAASADRPLDRQAVATISERRPSSRSHGEIDETHRPVRRHQRRRARGDLPRAQRLGRRAFHGAERYRARITARCWSFPRSSVFPARSSRWPCRSGSRRGRRARTSSTRRATRPSVGCSTPCSARPTRRYRHARGRDLRRAGHERVRDRTDENSSLVAVSTGLLQQWQREVDAVLGHEVSHVANGDMVTLTLLQGVVNTFVIFLSRVVGFSWTACCQQRARHGTGYLSRESSPSSCSASSRPIVMWFSRQREFRADPGGARLAGRER